MKTLAPLALLLMVAGCVGTGPESREVVDGPFIRLDSPLDGEEVQGPNVEVRLDVQALGVNTLRVWIGPEVQEGAVNYYVFEGLEPGPHMLRVEVVDANGSATLAEEAVFIVK